MMVAGLGLTSKAEAISFNLASYSVSVQTTDPALMMYSAPIQGPNYPFVLNNVGDTSGPIDLFSIGTTEGSVQTDDRTAFPVTVSYLFDLPPPAFGGSSSAQSVGFGSFDSFPAFVSCVLTFGDFDGCGTVVWSPNPALIPFLGGVLSVTLTDALFPTKGATNGVPKYLATVHATFKLESLDYTTVPEPTSLILLGSGLVGIATRVRRRRKG